MGPCSLQSLAFARSLYKVIENFFHRKFKCKSKFEYIKKICFSYMKKNSGENFQPLQVDSITGNYYIVIPEWMANELSWYEDTEIKISLDGDEIILTEKRSD